MINITSKLLLKIMPKCPKDKLDEYCKYLNLSLEEGQINTINRESMFLAQISHESCELKYWEEIASGQAYEGRKDLGNTVPGYGVKYKGHGPIQITGFNNHKECGEALGIDLVNNPRLLCNPDVGFRGCVWFWNKNNLNNPSDKCDLITATKIINGGLNGLSDREKYYKISISLLKNADIQQKIIILGKDIGNIDGILGNKSIQALSELGVSSKDPDEILIKINDLINKKEELAKYLMINYTHNHEH